MYCGHIRWWLAHLQGKHPSALHSKVKPSSWQKIRLTCYRVAHHDERRNEEGMQLQLDLLDEVRTMVEQWITRYQDLMAKHYNTKVKPWHFQVKDLVLWKVMTATKDSTQGKLGSNWEGPYRIDCHINGTYHLETLDKQRLHHPWNTEHLRRYYQ